MLQMWPGQGDDCLTNLNWLVQPANERGMMSVNPPTPPATPTTLNKADIKSILAQVPVPARQTEVDYKNEKIKPPYSYAQLIALAMQAYGGEKVVLTNIYQWIRENFAYFRGTDNSWQVPVTARQTEVDYKNEKINPLYSYAQLIALAMQAYGEEKVVLTNIYQWIRENFAYFRGTDNSWQNSIRHNLSLNRQFLKVPRDPMDKGKGSYWMLDPKSFSKDPYCIRRRNFFEPSSSRRCRPFVEKPQVNPAIKSFMEKAHRAQQTLKHPFGGTGEKVEDIGAQECVYTDTNPVFDGFNQNLFKKDVEQYSRYMPQNDLVVNTTNLLDPGYQPSGCLSEFQSGDKVRVEYNWEGYEYHPSNVLGAQLPTVHLSPGNGIPLGPTSVSLSPPNSDESDGPAPLDLRIPTPDWWTNSVTSANLLSPPASGPFSNTFGGSNNPLARVFENLNSSANSEHSSVPPMLVREHPWEEKLPLSSSTEDLGPAISSPLAADGLYSFSYASDPSITSMPILTSVGQELPPCSAVISSGLTYFGPETHQILQA